MKRIVKLSMLGIGAHWGFMALLYFVFFMFKRIFEILNSPNEYLPSGFAIEIFFVVIGGLIIPITAGMFISLLKNDESTSQMGKTFWTFSLLLLAPISLPLFFWKKVIRYQNLNIFTNNKFNAS